jgi:hypothetical protein
MTDRAMLEQDLSMAERHMIQGTEHVARQRELVARLENDGQDLFQAKQLLARFEELLHLHIVDRDRILGQLGLAAKSTP